MHSEPALRSICLISNYNLYESKRHFAYKFAEALERKGVSTLIIDAKETALNGEAIKRILDFKPTLTCSFNTMLPMTGGMYLWDELQLPHWSILVDPVLYNMGLAQSPYAMVSCVDLGDCQAMQKSTAGRVFFFPHAVERTLKGVGEKKKNMMWSFLAAVMTMKVSAPHGKSSYRPNFASCWMMRSILC